MSAARKKDNTLLIAIIAALALAGVILFVLARVRLPDTAKTKPAATATAATAIITRVETENTILLQDKSPLFLPTAVNSSAPALPAGFRREPDRALKMLPPRLTHGEYDMNVALPEALEVPGTAVQAARVGEKPNALFAFGRESFPYPPLSRRLAMLEVHQTRTGRMVYSAPLQAHGDEKLPEVDWQPLELMVAVEPSGLVGEPTLTSGSGFEEVDRFFRELLLRHVRIGARLAPGFYTLRVGP